MNAHCSLEGDEEEWQRVRTPIADIYAICLTIAATAVVVEEGCSLESRPYSVAPCVIGDTLVRETLKTALLLMPQSS